MNALFEQDEKLKICYNLDASQTKRKCSQMLLCMEETRELSGEGVCDWGASDLTCAGSNCIGTQSHARGELVETKLVTKQRVFSSQLSEALKCH